MTMFSGLVRCGVILGAAFFVPVGFAYDGAAEAPATVEEQIEAVESALAPAVLVEGRPRPNWTLEDRMRHWKVPGFSIAVVRDGQLAWSKTYGLEDAEQEQPVTDRTVFQAASISKSVTALATLKLVEQGKIDLDAPVNGYLKRWKIPDNGLTAQQPVTVRHLLSHTGGLTVSGFPGYAADADRPTVIQILNGEAPANTAPVRVEHLPGTRFSYSGGGYTVLQLMLEDVTGQAFPDLMERLIFDPAGMVFSTFRQPHPEIGGPGVARAHAGIDSEPVSGHSHIYPEMAAAGLWTNARDLARLALFVAGKGENGEPLLGAGVMAELVKPPVGEGYALGFGIRQTEDGLILLHGGANHGFRSLWFFHRNGHTGFFILANAASGLEIATEMGSAVAYVYDWSFGGSDVRKAKSLSAEERAAFTGHYVGSDDDGTYVLKVTANDTGLFLENDPYIPKIEIHMAPDGQSFFGQNAMQFAILFNGDGTIKGLKAFGLEFIRQGPPAP